MAERLSFECTERTSLITRLPPSGYCEKRRRELRAQHVSEPASHPLHPGVTLLDRVVVLINFLEELPNRFPRESIKRRLWHQLPESTKTSGRRRPQWVCAAGPGETGETRDSTHPGWEKVRAAQAAPEFWRHKLVASLKKYTFSWPHMGLNLNGRHCPLCFSCQE